ncbi:hypothetical protein GCM10022293_57190 [Azospirillum formosense]
MAIHGAVSLYRCDEPGSDTPQHISDPFGPSPREAQAIEALNEGATPPQPGTVKAAASSYNAPERLCRPDGKTCAMS